MTMDAPEALLRTTVDDTTYSFLSALLADKDMSVTNAAVAAGLEPTQGARLLRKAEVRHALGEMLRARRERHEDVRSSVVLMLWRMACADVRGAWTESGEQLAPHELPDDLAAVLESAKPIVSEGQVVAWHYTFSKRVQILDLLLKHFDSPKPEQARASNGTQARVIFRGVLNAEIEEE